MFPLKYVGFAVVLEEVPDEISLAFNISGCPHHCEGCHSQYLWEYKGDLLKENIETIVDQYKDYISCVCFMGGDQNINELEELCRLIKIKYQLKICIYSGEDNIEKFKSLINNGLLNYLKIGRYNKTLGGLDCKNTNQKIYKIKDKQMQNITYKFQRKKVDNYRNQ